MNINLLTADEVRQIVREELEAVLAVPAPDDLGGVELAMEITKKAKPTIYSLVNQRLIPFSKQGKKLYFSRKELLDWIANGTARPNKFD